MAALPTPTATPTSIPAPTYYDEVVYLGGRDEAVDEELGEIAQTLGERLVRATTHMPVSCSATWPVTEITTAAKGQSPTNNAKLSHLITAHIIDPDSLGETAYLIEVCEGTSVTSVVTDSTGMPTNTARGSLACNATGCSGIVHATERYQSISEDGRDKDAITFISK
jgi:hypothetical protein